MAKQKLRLTSAASERGPKALKGCSYFDPGVLSIDTFLTVEDAEEIMSSYEACSSADEWGGKRGTDLRTLVAGAN